MNEWDYAFLMMIGFFTLILVFQIYGMILYQCPEGMTIIFLSDGDRNTPDKWTCINSSFLEGGSSYRQIEVTT